MEQISITLPTKDRNHFVVQTYNQDLDFLVAADVKIKNEILRLLRNAPPEPRWSCHQIMKAVAGKHRDYNLSRDFAWLFIGDRLKELANHGNILLTKLHGSSWRVFWQREVLCFNPKVQYVSSRPTNSQINYDFVNYDA